MPHVALPLTSSKAKAASSPSAPADPKPKLCKKRRFRGWVCEDEISDNEAPLGEKIENQGRTFATRLTSSPLKPVVARKAPPSPDMAATTPCRSRVTDIFDPIAAFPPTPRSQTASPRSKQRTIKAKTASTERSSERAIKGATVVTSKKTSESPIVTYSRKSKEIQSATTRAPSAKRNEDLRPPKKKRRFHGYICEDEVEKEEDTALVDKIRQKGTLFAIKGDGWGTGVEAATFVDNGRDVDDAPQSPEIDKITSHSRRSYPTAPNQKSEVRNPPNSRFAKPKPGPFKQQPPPQSQCSPQPFNPLERAQTNVKAATQDAKRFQVMADEAAKAAAIAKRRALDAANQLEEAKRILRTEREKKKAHDNGLKYHPGFVWEDLRGIGGREKGEKHLLGQVDAEEKEEDSKNNGEGSGAVKHDGLIEDDEDEETDMSTDDDCDDSDEDDEGMTETESEIDSVQGQTKDLLR